MSSHLDSSHIIWVSFWKSHGVNSDCIRNIESIFRVTICLIFIYSCVCIYIYMHLSIYLSTFIYIHKDKQWQRPSTLGTCYCTYVIGYSYWILETYSSQPIAFTQAMILTTTLTCVDMYEYVWRVPQLPFPLIHGHLNTPLRSWSDRCHVDAGNVMQTGDQSEAVSSWAASPCLTTTDGQSLQGKGNQWTMTMREKALFVMVHSVVPTLDYHASLQVVYYQKPIGYILIILRMIHFDC